MEPLVECSVCMDDELRVSEAFTLNCSADHRYCYPCVTRQVRVSLAERKIATCVLCKAPPHAFTQTEVRELFGADSAELKQHQEVELANFMASNPDRYIACPTAGEGLSDRARPRAARKPKHLSFVEFRVQFALTRCFMVICVNLSLAPQHQTARGTPSA